jgi:micrococcal nuclease
VPPDAAATWTAVALTALPATPTPVGGGPLPGTPVPTTLPGADYGSVTYVVDGDTIDVSLGGQDFRVRYIGVNTPERGEPCFDQATAANRVLVENQIVALVRDVSETDQYGRLLRYVYVGDAFVNAALVEAGWAESRRYPPDTLYGDTFDALEDAARAANLGCWPAGVFEP